MGTRFSTMMSRRRHRAAEIFARIGLTQRRRRLRMVIHWPGRQRSRAAPATAAPDVARHREHVRPLMAWRV